MNFQLLLLPGDTETDALVCAELQKQGVTGSVLVSKLLPTEEWNVFCSLGKCRSAGSIVAVRRTSDQACTSHPCPHLRP